MPNDAAYASAVPRMPSAGNGPQPSVSAPDSGIWRVAATASAGFGLFAGGLASALLFQLLFGVGIAATYMPGLRLLSDRLSGAGQSRSIATYTSFFGIGIALSLAAAGVLASSAGWRVAFVVGAIGPLIAGALVFLLLQPLHRQGPAARRFSLATLFPLQAWREVLRNRAAAGYTAGYMAHCLELFGSRGWMVAFLAYSASLHAGGETFPWQLPAIAAVVNLLAVPASIFGNEAALRVGRRRWILLVMASSGSCGILLGFAAPWHWALVLALLIVYSMLVMGESGTLTAGLVAAAPAELRGAAMGLYSLLGFAGGLLGPVVFGVALDAAGGAANPVAWVVAYAAIGAGCLAAPLVARLMRP